MFESRGRQAEFALFMLARSQEVVYRLLKRRGWVGPVAGGETLLLAAALALNAFFYFDCPAAIKPTHLKLLNYLLQEV